MDSVRGIFRIFNRYFMVPMFRLGLGAFMGNPLTGYVMVIKSTGRKSGRLRFTPVNYAIIDGNIYCTAGFGRNAHWYLNLMANPRTELMMPGGAISVQAEEVQEKGEALQALKQIFRNAGFAGFFEGYNPYKSDDAKFLETLENAPVIRLHPLSIGSGAYDPGGWTWLLTFAVSILILWLILR